MVTDVTRVAITLKCMLLVFLWGMAVAGTRGLMKVGLTPLILSLSHDTLCLICG